MPWKSDNGEILLVHCYYSKDVADTIISLNDVAKIGSNSINGNSVPIMIQILDVFGYLHEMKYHTVNSLHITRTISGFITIVELQQRSE